MASFSQLHLTAFHGAGEIRSPAGPLLFKPELSAGFHTSLSEGFCLVQCLTYLGRGTWHSCLLCQHSALEVLRERQLELELFGLDPAGYHFSSVFQADMDILMCQQPSPCHQLAGTFHLAPAKAAQSNPTWPCHSCLTATSVPLDILVHEPKQLLLAEVGFVIFFSKTSLRGSACSSLLD